MALATTVIFGIVPAIQSARQDPQEALSADGRHSTSGTGRRRLRAALTIGEVALSVALLIGAGLLIRSFARLQQVDPGFRTSNLMTARVTLPATAYPDGPSRRAFYDRFLADLRGRPGIEAAAIASGPPLSGDFTGGDVKLPTQSNDEAGSAAWRLAGPGYFAALGIPVRGREFTDQDRSGEPVAIVSAALAAEYYPNEDPIGRPLIMRSFSEEPALAAIGLFGVMAYLVSQRTREIGVRLALGATRGEVFRLILARGLTLAVIGAAGGVGAALWLTRVMETLLFSVSRTDPTTFVVVPLALITVAALACYIPARRAMRVDPVVALRGD